MLASSPSQVLSQVDSSASPSKYFFFLIFFSFIILTFHWKWIAGHYPYCCSLTIVPQMRLKAWCLTQHDGSPGWLEEIDPAGCYFVCVGWSLPPALMDHTTCPYLGMIYYWMYTKHRHELRHARKAWLFSRPVPSLWVPPRWLPENRTGDLPCGKQMRAS